MYKKKKGYIQDYTGEQLHKDNIHGLLITDYPDNDLDEKLVELFKYIIRRLKNLYETKKESMKITSYSNFFKSEPIYELILKDFDEIDGWDVDKLNDYLVVFEKKGVLDRHEKIR